jgi:NADPH:quinone reductase-like Zn-dependent oxidoreductase
MRAVVAARYGSPGVLDIVEETDPTPGPGQVVVRVVGTSVNPVDWHRLRGRPYLLRLTEGLARPKNPRLGADVSGVVEAIGSEVTTLRPGDEVFGFGTGAYAEKMAIRAEGVVPKPPNVGFAAAGVVGVAAITALQGLRDHGRIAPGQRVLVCGAGGGVGTFAVQIAKALGAEVVATTSADKLELVRSIGADEVLDYARTDATIDASRFPLIFDAGGWLPLRSLRRALTPDGTAVLSGAGPSVSAASVVTSMAGGMILTRLGSRRFVSFLATRKLEDLQVLGSMLQAGQVRPVIDRTYPLAEIADAIRYQESGHAAGKVAISIGPTNDG